MPAPSKPVSASKMPRHLGHSRKQGKAQNRLKSRTCNVFANTAASRNAPHVAPLMLLLSAGRQPLSGGSLVPAESTATECSREPSAAVAAPPVTAPFTQIQATNKAGSGLYRSNIAGQNTRNIVFRLPGTVRGCLRNTAQVVTTGQRD